MTNASPPQISSQLRWPLSAHLTLALAAALLHAGVTTWRLRDAYFFADDFLFLGLARSTTLLDLWQRDMFGHVEPVTMAVHWLFARLAGWNYAAAQAVLIGSSSLAVFGIGAIAGRSRTPLSIALIILAAAALSWSTIEPDRWWSSGAIVAVSLPAHILALWISAHPNPRLSLLQRFALAAALVVTCASYNKAVFLIALCAGVRLFIMRSAEKEAALTRHILAVLRELIPAIAAVGLFFLYVLKIKLESDVAVPPLQPMALAQAVAGGAQFGWWGGLVGPRASHSDDAGLVLAAALVIDIVVIGVVLASLRLNRMAAWLWLALAAVCLAGIALIAAQRIDQFGIWSATAGRYNTDAVFLTFGVAMVAFGAAYHHKAAAPPRWAAAAGAILIASLQCLGANHYPQAWDTVSNRRFMTTFMRDAAALTAADSVAVRQAPTSVAPSWIQPWNDIANIATVKPLHVRMSNWDTATHFMDDAGRLHPFADSPQRVFASPDGGALTLLMAPAFEDVGALETRGARSEGWFNPMLAAPDRMRVAIASGRTIVAWARIHERPDLVSSFNRQGMLLSGFAADVPEGVPQQGLRALLVIDDRIAIVLPQRRRRS